MKTRVFLNEGTMMTLNISEEELHAKIIDKQDKDGNFIDVECEGFYNGGPNIINKKIKLYTKRILFFYGT